jgi:hypothetical protein
VRRWCARRSSARRSWRRWTIGSRPNPAIYWRAPEHALHGLIRNSWSVHAQQHLSSLLDELENCS